MMNDDVAESDEVSAGPTTARVLSLLRPLTRPIQEEDAAGGALSMEMEIDGPEPSSGEPKPETHAPASAFPESTWKNTTHAPRQDYAAMDDRLLQELRYIGFLSPTDQPNYADIADDEVTARLRYLQRELRQTILTNGARKARVLEVASDRMAIQEWQNISDDLDSQLNQAYSKRNRNIGKGKKQVKRPGGPGGGSHPIGIAKPAGLAVGEPVRSLMERRSQWHDLIGPVVDFGKVGVPKETIFEKDHMDRLLAKEQDNWTEEIEEA
jgi:transcriptional adapter 3